jgi:hypothetical protein
MRLGKAKSWIVPRRRSSHAVRLFRASDMISNCTGLPVFCWMTVERFRMLPPLTTSPILIFTRSHPRSLLSMAQVEQRPVAQSLVLVEVEPNGPYIAWFERTLGSNGLTRIPGAPFVHGRVQV